MVTFLLYVAACASAMSIVSQVYEPSDSSSVDQLVRMAMPSTADFLRKLSRVVTSSPSSISAKPAAGEIVLGGGASGVVETSLPLPQADRPKSIAPTSAATLSTVAGTVFVAIIADLLSCRALTFRIENVLAAQPAIHRYVCCGSSRSSSHISMTGMYHATRKT